ncbi:hypothetical protein PM082_010153 [Marasmius tenuissimus]|nr:hypothetical protein PM082_010153 [Marasmius tenuissimus]
MEHCQSSCMGYSTITEISDRFDGYSPAEPSETKKVTRSGSGGGNMSTRKHRFPEIEQIVARVSSVRDECLNHHIVTRPRRKLDRLYITTNGKREWLKELKGVLKLSGSGVGGGCKEIATSRRLTIMSEQRYVSQTVVDVHIGSRATVCIGMMGREKWIRSSRHQILVTEASRRCSNWWIWSTLMNRRRCLTQTSSLRDFIIEGLIETVSAEVRRAANGYD